MLPNLPRGMAHQIYQAWLQGPHALFRLFEDSFGRQALYRPPDPDEQEQSLSEQIGRLRAQVERLRAEASDLRGQPESILKSVSQRSSQQIQKYLPKRLFCFSGWVFPDKMVSRTLIHLVKLA